MANKAPLSKERINALLMCATFDDQLGESEKKTMLSMAALCGTLSEELFKPMMVLTCEMLARVCLVVRQTRERKEASARVLDGFMKNDDRKYGNHLLCDLWLPWAKKTQFVTSNDCLLLASDDGAESESLRHEQVKTSWSIPTTSVLKYMVENSPSRKITELGAGRGYWTKLLRKFGGQVTAVDDKSEQVFRPLIRDIIKMDATAYLQRVKAQDSALFFCWPRMKNDGGRWVETCLEEFMGDTVFYVGELDRGCTFEIDQWLKDTGEALGWRIIYKQAMPAFCGVRDEFLHLKKHKIN